ncbi:nicotinate-nucleotide--dimethylbenzimidazole phosphoribosyltransferase [Insolitispirillum peregrinum]|uniref:nicotinate-nucleotide--dimethylbenzimidazole phosphoribosyltransferase n=1 Tax=Insolitispirillum peregrinum TaxID=80876 RepID=UPI003609AA58
MTAASTVSVPVFSSLDDVRSLLATLPGPDLDARGQAETREPQLTKPRGSLGRLEDLAAWLASWQHKHPGTVAAPHCIVFAGNHGVAARGVSAYPAAVTVQMVANYQHDGAAINQLCRANGVTLAVVSLDLETPTADFTQGAAMSEAEVVAALSTGVAAAIEAARQGADLLCLGEMGIGNSTSAAAICHALFGGTATGWTGPGTGVHGVALSKKAEVVAEAVALHKPEARDALDMLRRLGGRELAAIAGAVIGARLAGMVVVLDGFICTAAAAALEAFRPGALDHCVVSHKSCEPGHALLFAQLGKLPLLDLGLRLGEASGAVTAVPIVRAAAACHAGMATFAQAGVSDKD